MGINISKFDVQYASVLKVFYRTTGSTQHSGSRKRLPQKACELNSAQMLQLFIAFSLKSNEFDNSTELFEIY